MQLSFVGRNGIQCIAHPADPRLLQVDEFQFGYRLEDRTCRISDARHSRVLMQTHTLAHRVPQQWAQIIKS